jgi:HD superfamily phosphohydrolase
MDFNISFPDPVYGRIRATEFERYIIDLPEFQRLKRIKQLGVAHVIFPGAIHTRFEHCVGTMHVADLIFQRF